MNNIVIEDYCVAWIGINEILDTCDDSCVPAIFKGGLVTYGRSEFSVDIEKTTLVSYYDKSQKKFVEMNMPLGRHSPVYLLDYHNVDKVDTLAKAMNKARHYKW